MSTTSLSLRRILGNVVQRAFCRRRYIIFRVLMSTALLLWIHIVYKLGSGLFLKKYDTSADYKLIAQNHTRIIFMETSGKGFLSLRQCAAVESAAFWNPKKNIQVFIFVRSPSTATSSCMLAITRVHHNVKYTSVRMLDFVFQSPLEDWYLQGKWRLSKIPAAHTSDGLRFLELWRSGGIYLDLDVMTLKELRFPKNTVMWENTFYIASGILAFESQHPLMYAALRHFIEHYNPQEYVVNGPPVVTQEFHKYRRESGKQCDVTLLPVSTATPLIWEDGRDYFDETKADETIRKIRGSYAAHWWNDLSYGYDMPATSKCAFMVMVKRYCPLTYAEIFKEGRLGGP